MAVEFSDPEAFGRAYSDYIRQVNQSEGFDQENITTQMPGVMIYDQCGDYQLVYLYAKLGLHRFNLLMGTNIQLDSVTKHWKTIGCASSYLITLIGVHQLPNRSEKHVFQVRVEDNEANGLSLTVPVSRLRPSSSSSSSSLCLPESSQSSLPLPESSQSPLPLPEWPSLDAISDTNRFLLVKESELESSYSSWIHLYLLLQVWKEDGVHDLTKLESNLKIVKVVIETIDEDVPTNERLLRLRARSAIAYITFKGAAIPREDVERKAIIRRVLDKRTGELSLCGHLVGVNRPRWGPDEIIRRFRHQLMAPPASPYATETDQAWIQATEQAWIQARLDHQARLDRQARLES